MKRKVTIKQIAKELSVSISTVSKSLRNSKEIGEETKQKVQAFAKLFHYKPNHIALSLKNRRSMTIGIIIPEVVHYFFSTIISGVEEVAKEKGYRVIICLSYDSLDNEVKNFETLSNGNIDGFIVTLSKETELKRDYTHIQEAIDLGIPVVMFDRYTDDVLCDKIIIDDKSAACKAVNLFIEKGRKRTALITTFDYISVGKLRTDGFKKALTDNNIPLNEKLILKIGDDDDCEGPIKHLLETQKIDSILAVNELYAVTAIKAIQNMGLSVPNDIAVIAFTDGIISKYSTPTITTINQNGKRMGKRAAKALIERIEMNEHEQNDDYTTEVIDTTIIERESTNI